MSITIKEIAGNRALKKFVKFSIDLYEDNEYYVPSLVLDEVGTLSAKSNPAFDFCESVYYMAYRDGKPMGRIAGIINRKVNEKTGEKAARFGFVPEGRYTNEDYLADKVFVPESCPLYFRDMLFSPETSGGLLLFMSPDDAGIYMKRLDTAFVIGEAVRFQEMHVKVV